MFHLVAGCPEFDLAEKVLKVFDEKKIDFVEIQFPFSDPVADGPILMAANEISLEKNGTKIADCFDFVARVASKFEFKIFLMGYFNLIFRFGVEQFCAAAKRVGATGLIFPDVPFDEIEFKNLAVAAKKNNLQLIQVVSEITPDERLEKMREIPGEFIYCVSRFGVTGSGKMSENLPQFLKRVREKTGKKLAVGFGIRTKKDLQKVYENAEIVVVGSAFSEIFLKENLSESEKLAAVQKLVAELES
jgi:tryptophan synthase alpha chain